MKPKDGETVLGLWEMGKAGLEMPQETEANGQVRLKHKAGVDLFIPMNKWSPQKPQNVHLN